MTQQLPTDQRIEVYRGGESGHWFSSSERHAAYFGPVTKYTVSLWAGKTVTLTLEEIESLGDGYEADDALEALLDELGAQAAILPGWEQHTTSYYLRWPEIHNVERIEQ